MSINAQDNSSDTGKLPRRSFIQNGGLLTGGFILSPLLSKAGFDIEKPVDEVLLWYQRPLRIMHTV
ncbi:MAG: hypothetical protein H0U39_11825, partial [Segetibacter sp.]|nr:hypothetical protein [Segetibacter sp.]